MAYTLGIDLDIDQVKLCLVYVEGPHKVPHVDWVAHSVPFRLGPDYYCEFGRDLIETIAGFLFVKKIDPGQLNKIYFVSGMPYSAFQNFEEGLHYTANVFIQSLFDPDKVGFVRSDGKPYAPRDVLGMKGEYASAFVATNFYGSAYLASRLSRNALLVEVGARETYTTPILKGLIDPVGRSRITKYLRFRSGHHQIVPSGIFYTPLNQISQGAMLKGLPYYFTSRLCRMSALCSLLQLVSPEVAREHDFPLPKEKDAHILLARAIGLDLATIAVKELQEVAQVVFDSFCDQIGRSVEAVLKEQNPKVMAAADIISTGVGGKPALNQALRRHPHWLSRVSHLADRLPHRLHEATTAYGIALYAMERLMDESFAPDKVKVLA